MKKKKDRTVQSDTQAPTKEKGGLKKILRTVAIIFAVILVIGFFLPESDNDGMQGQSGNKDVNTTQPVNENVSSPESSATVSATQDNNITETPNQQDKVDYTAVNLAHYYGAYHSPSGTYGITLSEDTEGNSIYVELVYSTGEMLWGHVEPGNDSILLSGDEIWGGIELQFLEDGTVHISLTPMSDTENSYDEDLIPGDFTEIFGVTSAKMLANMNDERFLTALAQVERNCTQMDAATVTGNPELFCDGKTYRFPGIVDSIGDSGFLLKIAETTATGVGFSQMSENNLIFCRSYDYPVSVGEKICVYGEGIGRGNYTKVYSDGAVIPYETLAVDVGYILRDGGIEYGNKLTDYMQDYVYGNYKLRGSSSTPYILEDMINFNPDSINGRAYHINRILLDFSYGGDVTTIMSNSVILQVETTASVRRGQEQNVTFRFKLDGSGCSYTSAWETGTVQPGFDSASYDRVD